MVRTKQSGFTLIELMIVIAIIAIIAAIAIPNLLAARLSANETAAAATLRNVVSSQAQFQQGAKADQDGDGSGEYGGFIEMSGKGAGRMTAVLTPPVLGSAFQVLNAQGAVTRSGYFFKMWLPSSAGAGVAENQTTGYTTSSGVDSDRAETTWCCYAWPVNYNQTGNRTFFTNQQGDVLSIEVSTYTGPTGGPGADAAFKTSGTITGVADLNGPGQSGQTASNWKQVG
ncbi:MAG: DUF2950 family protein [Planctomycetia bacterium]